ncbi:MAG: enoyl-CoA hydratase/isomerase family protein [Sphingobacteriales bacterium]|nr:enoyl-CoA hydratase/isomerase family protein [Sphingobacteriales bacterium]
MNYQTLLTILENGILTVVINRADKLNALNKEVFTELNQVLDEIEKSPAVKSVIITGAGSKAFVAGADITEFGGLNKQEAMALAKRGQDTFARIENSSKPIVAAVNGFALGGGCELAMSCHFRIAAENAKFGQPEVNLGLIPGYGGTQRLVQLVGKGRAMELLLSARMIDANEAKQSGLVNEVTTPDSLLEHTRKILETINSKAPLAIAACIRAANAVFDESRDGYALETEEFGNAFNTEDMKEGTTAFLEKRKAVFTGR